MRIRDKYARRKIRRKLLLPKNKMIYWFSFYPAAHYPQPGSLQEYWLESCRFRMRTRLFVSRAHRRLIVRMNAFAFIVLSMMPSLKEIWYVYYGDLYSRLVRTSQLSWFLFPFLPYRYFPYMLFFIIITYGHLSERGRNIIPQHVAHTVTMGADHSRTYNCAWFIWGWNKKKILRRGTMMTVVPRTCEFWPRIPMKSKSKNNLINTLINIYEMVIRNSWMQRVTLYLRWCEIQESRGGFPLQVYFTCNQFPCRFIEEDYWYLYMSWRFFFMNIFCVSA